MSESSSPKTPSASKQPSVSEAGDKPTDSRAQHPHPANHANRGGKTWLTLFLLVLLAGIGAGGYFLWYTLQTTRQQLSTDRDTTRQQLDTLNQRTAQLEQNLNKSLAADIQALKAQQQTLEDSIANLRTQQDGDARIWDIKEIATLLQIANDRLHLEKEVAPSLAALEAADRHLRALNNPALLEVRRHLAEEISSLRATPDPDISGMALSLNALIQGIDRLPIASTSLQPQATATSPDKGWRGVVHDLWEKLKSLVSIHHHGEADRPLLAPDQRYFLRQNLRLSLEAARIALLRRDDPTYRQTLRSAQEWITLYFDNDAAPTAGALQELAHLQQADISPSLPDISGSLNALQTWLTEQQSHQANATSRAAHP